MRLECEEEGKMAYCKKVCKEIETDLEAQVECFIEGRETQKS